MAVGSVQTLGRVVVGSFFPGQRGQWMGTGESQGPGTLVGLLLSRVLAWLVAGPPHASAW